MKKWALIMGFLVMADLHAASTIDVYGVDASIAEKILEKYAAVIKDTSQKAHKEFAKDLSKQGDEKKINQLSKVKKQLIEKIKLEGNFAYVNFCTVNYGGDELSTTIEVVQKKDIERLRFLNPQEAAEQPKKFSSTQQDVVDKMNEYEEKSLALLMDKRTPQSAADCPVYHCTAGFEHVELRPYLKMFNQAALKRKAFILKTLASDPDPERRKAAAFLVGHFKDPNEIITLMTSYSTDSDEGVRNNAMRVLGSTMAKAHQYKIDVTPFIELLNSPYTTDRNKALYILLTAAKDKRSAQQIAKQGKDYLPALLALKQPNNHDFAYLILKQLSGKDLGEYNVSAWKKWLYSNPNV